MSRLVLVTLLALASSDVVARPERRHPRGVHRLALVQITGRDPRVGQTRWPKPPPADPYVDVLPSGRVRVYGTGRSYLEADHVDELLRPGRLRVRGLESDGPVGWDALVHRWPNGPEVLYGGLATPESQNWTRRIWPFVRGASGRWVRKEHPLFGAIEPGARPGFLGHTYGHHFKRVGQDVWLFHEEVVGERPMVTELFARRMLDPFTADAAKTRLLGVGSPPRHGRRANGDYLIEGPRPFEVELGGQTVHFITFSSGDFYADNYDMHFAWRRGHPIGEYTPLLDASGELLRVGGRLKERYGLSWLGRAHVIRDGRGQPWAVFHAVDKRVYPGYDYSGRSTAGLDEVQRQLFAVPLRFGLDAHGNPTVEAVDERQRLLGTASVRALLGPR